MNTKFYYSLKQNSQDVLEIEKSKFLCFSFCVQTKEQTDDILHSYKNKYKDATHVCYAYVLGSSSQIQKCSDDGEPSGTAGLPILKSILQQNLTNVLVIVVRYFGGTLLGSGGLIRAYSQSASKVLTSKIKFDACCLYKFSLFYNKFNVHEQAFKAFGAMQNIVYGSEIEFDMIVKDENADKFEDFLNQNQIEFIKTPEKCFFSF